MYIFNNKTFNFIYMKKIFFLTILFVLNFSYSQTDSYSMAQYYDGGKIKSLINHATGEFKLYHENGNIKQRGYYKTSGIVSSNKKIDIWSTFNQLGYIEKVINYSNTKLYEKVKFDKDNVLISGEWSEIYNNGQIYFTANFENYIKQGEFKLYFSNGQFREIGNFKNDFRTGKWKFFRKDGTLWMEGSFINGKRNGIWIRFSDETGKKRATIYFKDNERHGETIFFYSDGTTHSSKGNYEKGNRVDKWISYHNNGKIYQQKAYSNDKLIEILFTYDGQGRELDIGSLKNGNGTVKEYSIDGEFIKETEYINGVKKE